MNKYIVIVLFFLSGITYSQLLKVEYERINLEVTTDKSFSEEFKKKKLEQDKLPEKFTLYYDNGNSFFKSVPIQMVKHENAPITIGETTTTMVEQSIKLPTKIFKLKNEDQFYFLKQKEGKSFYKKTKLVYHSVEYKDETQLIDKFVCQLVEVRFSPNGDVFKIWYTEDLPISAGPFTYGDFPGLVLKVEAPKFVIYATNISQTLKSNEIEKLDQKLPVE